MQRTAKKQDNLRQVESNKTDQAAFAHSSFPSWFLWGYFHARIYGESFFKDNPIFGNNLFGRIVIYPTMASCTDNWGYHWSIFTEIRDPSIFAPTRNSSVRPKHRSSRESWVRLAAAMAAISLYPSPDMCSVDSEVPRYLGTRCVGTVRTCSRSPR